MYVIIIFNHIFFHPSTIPLDLIPEKKNAAGQRPKIETNEIISEIGCPRSESQDEQSNGKHVGSFTRFNLNGSRISGMGNNSLTSSMIIPPIVQIEGCTPPSEEEVSIGSYISAATPTKECK